MSTIVKVKEGRTKCNDLLCFEQFALSHLLAAKSSTVAVFPTSRRQNLLYCLEQWPGERKTIGLPHVATGRLEA